MNRSAPRALLPAVVLVAAVAAAGVTGCVLTAAGGLSNEGGAGASMEADMDRPGADYDSFEVDGSAPADCRAACAGDRRCTAYTYVRPGVAGARAVCRLKGSIPNAVASDCCVSGVKGLASTPPPPLPPPHH